MKNFAIGTLDNKKPISVDLEVLLRTRLLIQASSGAGKTYTIRKLLESSWGLVQHIILDIEGEFGTLREKYPYVQTGVDGDGIVATPQTAGLLARKVLETNVNIIVDLYELPQSGRIEFVRTFLESMLNAKKNLWHPCLVILDEAHIFAPERAKSRSLESVIDLASRGRKRGFCLIPATQRLSKLHKDVAAECQNKLIGLCNLALDRKRAAEELGLFEKEQVLALRDFDRGQFYAVGPAFSARGENIITISATQTKAFKYGTKESKTVVSGKEFEKAIASLADLPKQVESEMTEVERLKREVLQLRQAKPPVAEKTIVEVEVVNPNAIKQIEAAVADLLQMGDQVTKAHESMKNAINAQKGSMQATLKLMQGGKAVKLPVPLPAIPNGVARRTTADIKQAPSSASGRPYGKCENLILDFLSLQPDKAFSRAQIGVMTGYSYNSGSFSNSLSYLKGNGDITKVGSDNWQISRAQSGRHLDLRKAIQDWFQRLGKAERMTYKLMRDSGRPMSIEELASGTGYSVSGSYTNALSKLKSLGLIVKDNGCFDLNPEVEALLV